MTTADVEDIAAALVKIEEPSMSAVNSGVTKLVSGRRGLSLVSFDEHTHLPRTRTCSAIADRGRTPGSRRVPVGAGGGS